MNWRFGNKWRDSSTERQKFGAILPMDYKLPHEKWVRTRRIWKNLKRTIGL